MVKWILTVMLFSTTPSTVKPEQQKDHDLFEQKHVWALQTTSTTEFSSYDACWSAGDQFVGTVFPVGTLTVRTWCTCDGDEKACPADAVQVAATLNLLRAKKQKLGERWNEEQAFLNKDPKKNKEALSQLNNLRIARTKDIDESITYLGGHDANKLHAFTSKQIKDLPTIELNAPVAPFGIVPTYPYPKY